MFDGAFGESIAFFEVEIDRVGGGTDGKNGVGVDQERHCGLERPPVGKLKKSAML